MGNDQSLLDRYDLIIPTLGAGAMSNTLRARDRRVGRDVAIKLLPQSEAPGASVHFIRGARIAAMIAHPHVATVYEAGIHNNNAYIVTEYVEGTSLQQLMDRGPLPISTIVTIARQVAEGLAAIHSAGIVHRNLKPSKILLGLDTSVKIIDFGLAWLYRPARDNDAEVTEPALLIGTRRYMSPEQVSGHAITPSTDLFSLGVIIYEALTGHAPFDHAELVDSLVAIVHAEPQAISGFRPEAPDALMEIVRRLLAKSPEARPTAENVAAALREIGDVNGGRHDAEKSFSGALDSLVGELMIAANDARAYRKVLADYRDWASAFPNRSLREQL